MRLMVSFAALFLSAILVQLSSGGVAPLDALSGIQKGFSTTEVGLLGSSHFLGFFIGCWLAPRLMGNIGHSRAFAVFAAVGTIGILAHMMLISPLAWGAMRIMTGMTVAGCYTVIESWMQAKLTNKIRGKAMGAYRFVDMGGSLAAQLMISVLPPAAYVSYNLLAILCAASLLPLALSRASPPETPKATRLRPIMAMRMSPLATAGILAAGVSSSSFRMVGPVYGLKVGLSADQIGLFLAAFVLGGALAQLPAGWLADRYDRRWVMISLSVGAVIVSFATVYFAAASTAIVFAGAILFGLTTFPIFSVATAHGNDFATPEQMVELNASYIFLYAIGAIASPLIVSALIEVYGPAAMFVFIGIVHILLIAFSVMRMRARPTSVDRTRYAYMPRTTFMIGRLLRRRGRPEKPLKR